MESNNPYQKGFNIGYLMAQHEPDLLYRLLEKQAAKNEYFEGIKDGDRQYSLELEKAKQKERIKQKGSERDR